MGNILFRRNNDNFIKGYPYDLQERTGNRMLIAQSEKNGIICAYCSVALKPLGDKKIYFPIYCPICYDSS